MAESRTITENGITSPMLYQLLSDLIDLANANKAAIAGITAQLDADAGVTDTDYAANNDVTVANASFTVSV
jgi:hypothetical protein